MSECELDVKAEGGHLEVPMHEPAAFQYAMVHELEVIYFIKTLRHIRIVKLLFGII